MWKVFIIVLTLYLIANQKEVAKIIKYRKSYYRVLTQKSYFKTVKDKGAYGEYLISDILCKLNIGYSEILVNVYIPTEFGTSEIDVLFIHNTGIYLIESKNYSGTIHGDEKYKKWNQYLGNKTFKFINPVNQNKNHIKFLSEYLQEIYGVAPNMYSVIVFSNRCQFRSIKITSENTWWVQRKNLKKLMISLLRQHSYNLSDEGVHHIFESLWEYSQLTGEEKQQHIDRIQSWKDSKLNSKL